MYRQANMWEEALRVAKVYGGVNASKQVRQRHTARASWLPLSTLQRPMPGPFGSRVATNRVFIEDA